MVNGPRELIRPKEQESAVLMVLASPILSITLKVILITKLVLVSRKSTSLLKKPLKRKICHHPI